MKYLVESHSGWFVTDVANKRQAYSEGVKEFGRGNVKLVAVAKQSDIDAYIANKGEEAMYPSAPIGARK